MSNLRTSKHLLIFAGSLGLLALTGCSTLPGSRLGSAESKTGMKTFLAIGDKPLPVATGEAGSTVAADEPESPPSRRASNVENRVSGRVYDPNGDPVDGATVRLAVNAAPGGRVTRVTTDPTGGFTLRGLRPGSAYTLIAEWEGDHGPMSGRVDARTFDTDLRITLAPLDSRSDDGPRGSRVNRVSDQADIPADDRERHDSRSSGRPVVNEEDLPPAMEAEVISAPSGRSTKAAIRQPRQWSGGDRSFERDEKDLEKTAPNPPVSPDAEDDGPNPLPPAIEPAGARNGGAEVSSRGTTPTQSGEELTQRDPEDPLPAAIASSRNGRRPRNATAEIAKQDDDTIPGALVVVPETFAPVVIKDTPTVQDVEPAESTKSSRKFSSSRSTALMSKTSVKPAPRKRSGRPTWGDVTASETQPPPLQGEVARGEVAEAPEEVAQPPQRQLEADINAPDWTKPQAESTSPLPDPSNESSVTPGDPTAKREELDDGPPALRDDATAHCDYDARHRKINDFRLPDLQGRPVRFKDIDADLVLLDFWGTWCWPCLKSIPDLVALQAKYPGKKLQVVGVACEQGEFNEASRNVAAAAERLKINYPILLSKNDGSCPLQDAFRIGAFPTLILVDREGQVIWRDQGITPASFARLERLVNEGPPRAIGSQLSQGTSRSRRERSNTLQ